MIRQATVSDVDSIAEIFDLYRIFYKQKSDIVGARKFLLERIDHAESIIFIAEHGQQKYVAGFVQIYPIFSSISMKRSLILNDLFVREEYRKQGIAQSLLSHAQSYAREIKAKGLELSTAIDNYGAQRLYEKNKYAKDEEFFHYFLGVDV
jgi:ribosomal protein S18 acetylase RimI-like enzyme